MVGCDQCGHWDEFIACAGLFAGMPAPTASPQSLKNPHSCGSGRARERAGTAAEEAQT